jgi:hypothetical protein
VTLWFGRLGTSRSQTWAIDTKTTQFSGFAGFREPWQLVPKCCRRRMDDAKIGLLAALVRALFSTGEPCGISGRTWSGGANMKKALAVLGVLAGLSLAVVSPAAEEESPQDFMQLHQVEITFHQAGSTKNLGLMLSLFTDDAVLAIRRRSASVMT